MVNEQQWFDILLWLFIRKPQVRRRQKQDYGKDGDDDGDDSDDDEVCDDGNNDDGDDDGINYIFIYQQHHDIKKGIDHAKNLCSSK